MTTPTEVEVMVNYGARLEGPLDMVMLPMTVKDSSKRRVDVIVVQPWMSRLNFVQPGFRIVFTSLLAASKDAYDLRFSREDFTEDFFRVAGDVEISDGKKSRKRDSSGQPVDVTDYGVVVFTKNGDVKDEDGRHLCWDCNKIDFKVSSLVTQRIPYLPLTAITPQMGNEGKVINTYCVFIRNTQMYASRPTGGGGGPGYRPQGPSYVALTVAVVDCGWKWLPVVSWAKEDSNDSPERHFTMQIEMHTNQVTSLPWLTTGDVLRIHRAKVMRYGSVRNTTRLAHNGKEMTSVTVVPITEHNTQRDYQPGIVYNVRKYPVGPNTGEIFEETKKLHVFAAEALKRQSLKAPEDSSTIIGRVSNIEKASDRFHVSTATDDNDDPQLREVTILVRSPAQAMGKAFLFHHLRSGDWVMIEEMEMYNEKWNSYVAPIGRITRIPEWSFDVQNTVALMKKAEADNQAEQLEELVEPAAESNAENEQTRQSFNDDDYAWTQELERLPVGRSEMDKAIEQGGVTGPLLTQSRDGTVEVDDVFDFVEE